MSYDDFGRVRYRSDAQPLGKHTAHGAHLTLKGSYDVGSLVGLNGLDFYGRAGVALVRSDIKILKQHMQQILKKMQLLMENVNNIIYMFPLCLQLV